MKNWKQYNIDLGTVKQGTKHIMEFVSNSTLVVNKFSPGCSHCTSIKGYENNILKVGYNAEYLPVHLKKQGFQNIRKVITVVYEDGSKEILSFTAKIVE